MSNNNDDEQLQQQQQLAKKSLIKDPVKKPLARAKSPDPNYLTFNDDDFIPINLPKYVDDETKSVRTVFKDSNFQQQVLPDLPTFKPSQNINSQSIQMQIEELQKQNEVLHKQIQQQTQQIQILQINLQKTIQGAKTLEEYIRNEHNKTTKLQEELIQTAQATNSTLRRLEQLESRYRQAVKSYEDGMCSIQ